MWNCLRWGGGGGEIGWVGARKEKKTRGREGKERELKRKKKAHGRAMNGKQLKHIHLRLLLPFP